MIQKQLIRPDRLRRIPDSFSWLDHRLVRHRHIHRRSPSSLALYLFLVTVSDAQGLSYYSDKSIGRILNLEATQLAGARAELQQADLIAYRKPLYQVLSLEDPSGPSSGSDQPRGGGPQSIGEILRRAIEGGGQP